MTRKTEKPLVRIVDDDPDQLASLEIMLSAEGWDVACYERASDFFPEIWSLNSLASRYLSRIGTPSGWTGIQRELP